MSDNASSTSSNSRAGSASAPFRSDSPAGRSSTSPSRYDKGELRSLIRRQRRLRSPEMMSEVAGTLGANWPSLRSLANEPDLVLGYQPTSFEPDPRLLLHRALSEGVQVLLPRPVGSERLEWVSAEDRHLDSRLTKLPSPPGPAVGTGSEPLAGRSALMLLPALAADPTTGFRLGQGGGYYDRLIADIRDADCQVLLVTIVHDDELLQIPAQPHDQAVDAILTESGLRVVHPG